MDPRRLLTLAAGAALMSGCGTLDPVRGPHIATAAPPAPAPAGDAPAADEEPAGRRPYGTMAPIPNPPEPLAPAGRDVRATAVTGRTGAAAEPRTTMGRDAIGLANARARQPSRSDAFVGGLQIFSYAPGRVFEVWTAPLRVTTLTLGPGETVVSKAAGDTVRWQIGETTSGEGPRQRVHILLKPLEGGLETNLVLATNQRVYLIQLRSAGPDTFNAAVAWDLAVLAPPQAVPPSAEPPRAPSPLAVPSGPLDAGYRIAPQGRRPRWTPTSVVTDGIRTFIAFPPTLQADEAPALFVVGSDGQARMVNYRQQGGLMVVDRVIERAELRLGGKRGRIVRITRLGGGAP